MPYYVSRPKMSPALIAVIGLLMIGNASTAAAQGGCLPSGKSAQSFKTHIKAIVKDSAMRGVLQDMGIFDSVAAAVSLVTNDSICIEAAKSWAADRSLAYDSAKVSVVKIGTSAYVVRKKPTSSRIGSEGLFVCNQLFVQKGYLTW